MKPLALLLLVITSVGFTMNVDAKRMRVFKTSKVSKKKTICQDLGKPSKANGLLKTKITGSHFKRTSKGYTLVNAYARSR